jgi:GDPmannose 4,6-dehydratase
MTQRIAVVMGSGGQDGYYVSELLRKRGDRVVGIARGGLDLGDRAKVAAFLAELRPAEIYYLAGVFGSSESAAEDPVTDFRRSSEVHVEGWLNFLDAVHHGHSGTRLFYASSSRVFGNPSASPQDERTPHAPLEMYGITKSAGMQLGRYYRGRGVHCSSGILYNHESPRRPGNFVSRKIVQAAVDIKLGATRPLTLGSLSIEVDWGAAQDYAEAMTRILQLERGEDFIIASGTLHSVKQFVEAAFAAVELPWERHVVEDRSLLKVPPRAQALVGNPAALREATDWRPKTSFTDMVRGMVNAELQSRHRTPA